MIASYVLLLLLPTLPPLPPMLLLWSTTEDAMLIYLYLSYEEDDDDDEWKGEVRILQWCVRGLGGFVVLLLVLLGTLERLQNMRCFFFLVLNKHMDDHGQPENNKYNTRMVVGLVHVAASR
jgi:hypothetical protein